MAGQGKFGLLMIGRNLLEQLKKKCNVGGTTDKEIPISSWRKFYRIVNKAINDKTAMFARAIDKNKAETRLGDALKYIKKNQVHVIDIAKLF